MVVGEKYLSSNKGLSGMDLKVSPQGLELFPPMIGLIVDTKANSENHATTEEKELRIDTDSSTSEETKKTSDPQENLIVINFDGSMHLDNELIGNLVMEEIVHE